MNRRDALSRVAILLGGTVVGGSVFLEGCKPGDKKCVNKCMMENKESFSPECKQHMEEKRKEGVRNKK
jgi:hypothetical protein